MNIIIDLELNQVVQSWGNRNPTSPILVKSQDTPVMAVYFGKGQASYDLGASPGIRFALYVAGSPNALVDVTGFVRNVDSQNKAAYVAYPNFNTTQMQAAMAGLTTLSAIGEVRYQTPFGTIARTLDIPFTVNRSLLQESAYDTTTAAFTVPAVNATVTVHINHTGWLAPNQNITVGAGGGAYQVVSVTNPTDFVAKNLGGTANAIAGTVIPTGTTVGNTPTSALGVYPDPSTIELLIHKNQPNGYAGLNGASKLFSSVLPVDGQTVIVDTNGNLASGSILAYTSANFTTPAANGTVAVTLNSTASLHVGQYVRIPIAGYYQVTAITDSTHATIENMGDPLNAISGTTITSGAALLPAQAVSGGGGGGAPGQNAYTNTTAIFTVPSIGATVTVSMANTSWLGGNGYYVFITGAGYFAINSVSDATHAVLTNAGGSSNAPPGTTVPINALVAAAGPPGAPGQSGTGLAAYDSLSAAFTMPAANGSVTMTISNTAWISANQIIYVATAGYFQVASISSATQASITNLPYPGQATAGTVIAQGSRVSPGGLQGPQGAGGPGLNAFTTLSANFVQPAVNANVTVNVGTTAWMAPNLGIFIQGGGYYTVISIADLTHAVVMNLGGTANIAPGGTVIGTGTQTVAPAGTPGVAGVSSYTTTTANFTMPAAGASVTIALQTTAFIQQNQNIFVAGAGYFAIASIIDSTHVAATNLAASGNVNSGTVISSGAGVTTAGAIGPTGSPGPTGPTGGIGEAPTDGQIYGRQSSAWAVVTGGGGLISRNTGIELFDDFVGGITAPTTNPFGVLGWFALNFGGGGGLITSASMTVGPEIGVWQYTSPTAAPGVYQLMMGSINAGFCIAASGQGVLIAEWRVKISTLETVSNYADHRFGINGSNPSNATWSAAYFQYNVNISPNWQCAAFNGSTMNTADSGVAVNATGYVKLTITMNAAWTTATFAINGVTCATLTGVSWLGGAGWTPVVTAKWFAGTPSGVLLDWFYGKYTVSR